MSKLLRVRAVLDMTGATRSTLYRWMSEGRFPAPVKIGAHAVAWRSSDIDAWMASLQSTRQAVANG